MEVSGCSVNILEEAIRRGLCVVFQGVLDGGDIAQATVSIPAVVLVFLL